MTNFRLILPTNIENTMKILFLLFSYTTVIKTLERFAKLIKYTLTIIALFLLTTLWFSIYFRVRFKGIEVAGNENEIFYTISFTSITRSFFTLLNTAFLITVPDLPYFLEKNCMISYLIFWIYVFLSAVVLISLITSIFFFIYQKILSLNYINVCYDYPDFEERIDFILKQ